MPWAKTAAETWRHEKVQRALGMRRGLEAIGLWALALTWAVDTLSDGEIPPGQAVRLTGLVDVGELVDILVAVGLWDPARDGHRIHDFLDYNFSRDRIQADKAAREEAARIGGHARAKQAGRDGGGRFTNGHAGPDAGGDAGPDAGSDAGDPSSDAASPVLSVSRSTQDSGPSHTQRARETAEATKLFSNLEARGVRVNRANDHAAALATAAMEIGAARVIEILDQSPDPIKTQRQAALYVDDVLNPVPKAAGGRATSAAIPPVTRYGDSERPSNAAPIDDLAGINP